VSQYAAASGYGICDQQYCRSRYIRVNPWHSAYRASCRPQTQLSTATEPRYTSNGERITGKLATLKPELEAEFLIRKLGVFGSYARGEHGSESDLDVLVEFTEPVTLFELVRLENELTTRLGVELDLVTRASLKPGIDARVAEDIVYV